MRVLPALLILLILSEMAIAGRLETSQVSQFERRLANLEAQIQEVARLAGAPQSEQPGDLIAAACADCGWPGSGCRCEDECGDDCYPNWNMTGVIQVDMGFYSQDFVNRATLGDIDDGLGFRRARIGVVGQVAERTSYHLEFDFAQAQARFVDLWMQFHQTPVGNIRIGRYRQPFGMSELSSIREIAFLERPLTFALAPFRQTGIMLFDTAFDEQLTWAVSGYRYLSDNFGNVYADTGGYGLATRVTALLYSDQWRTVHIGLDYSYNDPGRGEIQYVSTNEFFVGQNPTLGAGGLPVLPLVHVPAFVDTGVMAAQRSQLFNVEGAVALGRLIVQSEARWARVSLTNGTTNTFPGAYVQLRYVFRGNPAPYKRSGGVFGRVTPLQPADVAYGDWGAWEFVARVSYLDLNGSGIPGPGRRLTDTTVGVNWYLNAHTKFDIDWIHADLADPIQGDSNADMLAVRAQVDF